MEHVTIECEAADVWKQLNIKQPKFPVWFGKGCEYLAATWEDTEAVAGPDWMEQEPILKFCNNGKNVNELEGNCRPTLCPKLK
jgi:hypothetical protein